MPAVITGTNVTDADLMRISRDNPGWQIERADDGAVIVSPTSTPGGAKSLEAALQLHAFAKVAGGKAFDSSTGFKTPAGGVVSPDASWASAERVRAFAGDTGYWATMPDVAIEVASRSDAWVNVKAKIDKYVADGATFAIALDPETREIHAAGKPPPGLMLDTGAIIDA